MHKKKNNKTNNKSKTPEGCEPLASIEKAEVAEKWNTRKAANTLTASHYQKADDLKKLGERLDQCCYWLGYQQFVNQSTAEVKTRLTKVSFCKARFCAICQARKSALWINKFNKAVPQVMQEHNDSAFLMLTLTVKNCEITDLRETLQRMSAAWNKLTRRRGWAALGWVRALEITRSKDAKAHPHYHILLHMPKKYFSGRNYKTSEQWAQDWKSALGVDYLPIVDIRKAYQKNAKKSAASSAATEVLKYAVKPTDLNACAEWLIELTRQTKNMRYLGTGGTLKDFIKEEVTNEELRTAEEQDSEALQPLSEAQTLWAFWHLPTLQYLHSNA